MAAEDSSKRVFDLRSFAPADIYFTLDDGSEAGHTYRLPGDPDIEVVARMLELEQLLQAREDETSPEIAQAIVEGKDLILDLIRQREPEVDDIRLGVGQLLTLFALITGGATVAASVAAALSDGMASPADRAELEGAEGELGEDGELVGAKTPLRSARRSSTRSSRSATRASGRRATGAD